MDDTGDIALLGWSFGNMFSLNTVPNVHQYSPDLQHLLRTRPRSLIMYASTICLARECNWPTASLTLRMYIHLFMGQVQVGRGTRSR
ncbi:hypothetical protein C8Q78DRAFT_448368 [Trametes maxima]|nr:hypothetical protein C8Q78DRAFT_448368 [Trametes maxima]